MLELFAFQETQGVKRLQHPTYTARNDQNGFRYGPCRSLCDLRNKIKEYGLDPADVRFMTRERIGELFPDEKNIRELQEEEKRKWRDILSTDIPVELECHPHVQTTKTQHFG